MVNAEGSVDPLRLDLAALSDRLDTRRLGQAPAQENELWDSIDSTNNRAAELASQGAPAGVIVMARQQTAGRGRQGRTWISPPDSGVYVSFLLRPERRRTDLPLHTIACGVACVKAIWECAGVEIGLKWVNDLIAGGKKVGGILCEIPSGAGDPGQGDDTKLALILGIGLNVRLDPEQLPDELRQRVDSLEGLCGQPVDPNLLVASLAKHLEQTLDLLDAGAQGQVLDAWRKHSVTLGKEIRAVSGSTEIEGIAIDIDQSGGLIVESKAAGRVTLTAGEISIRAADGSYA